MEIDWLLHTANCGEVLHSSGTFHKAVDLHIDSIITPLLSELIASVDRNGNLELALYKDNLPQCLFKLWQDIFKEEFLQVLQYKDSISSDTLLPRRKVPIINDGVGGIFFKANFPFSWLIQETTSKLMYEIKNLTGNNNLRLF